MQQTAAPPTLDIIDFLDDPELFEPWFDGSSWMGWHAVLKAIYCLPMSDSEIAFSRSIAGGRDPPTKPIEEAWIVAGRGAGKDSVASAICAFTAAMFNQANSTLRPGERHLIACLAVDREQAKIVRHRLKAAAFR